MPVQSTFRCPRCGQLLYKQPVPEQNAQRLDCPICDMHAVGANLVEAHRNLLNFERQRLPAVQAGKSGPVYVIALHATQARDFGYTNNVQRSRLRILRNIETVAGLSRVHVYVLPQGRTTWKAGDWESFAVYAQRHELTLHFVRDVFAPISDFVP